MSTPTVSVIIPVFGRPEMVINAIGSVLAQSYSNLEVIVVDDGSEPALDLPSSFSEHDMISQVRLERNRGPSSARNAGAEAASGEWLAWLDSDDLWDRNKLEKQLTYLRKLGDERERTALATGFMYVDDAGTYDVRIPVSARDPKLFFSGCWFCPGSTVVLSRKLFERVGPYDETLRRLEDLDWFARMALMGGRLDVIPENLVTIRAGQKAPYKKVKRAGDLLLAKYHRKFPGLPRRARQNLLAYVHLECAASAIKADHNRLLGMRHLAASWRNCWRTRLHLSQFWH